MKHSHTQWLAVAALMLALTSPLAAQPTAALKHPAFAADERPDAKAAHELSAQGATLLDVRSQEEWDAGHIRDAVFLPWRRVEEDAARFLPDKNAPIVTYCAVGLRALIAARELRRLGYRHVTAMTGGYKDWKELGYPTAQPTMPPSTSAP